MVSGKEKEKSAAVTPTMGMDGSSPPQAAEANSAMRLPTRNVANRNILITFPSFL